MSLLNRLWGSMVALGLAFGLAGCITINPGFRPATTPTPPPPQAFVGSLIAALVSRDGAILQTMMGNPFVLAQWQGDVQTLPPEVALDVVMSQLLDPTQTIAFVTNDVINGWLGGVDPLTLWPPDVKVVDAVGVSVGHTDGVDEAILLIAEDTAGAPYWYALLLAPGGFASQPGVATPIIAPSAPLPPQGMLPTDITKVLVLGSVGIFDGPGATFNQIGVAARGETYTVRGVSADGQWWAVTCSLGATPCWIGANPTFVRPVGQPPVVTNTPLPPATNTPLPPSTNTPRPTLAPVYPIRINFAPGQSSAVVRAPIAPFEAPQYVLFAQAGQTLHILVTSPSPTTNFSVRGVNDGVLYKSAQDGRREWSTVLPRSQDYLITLSTAVNTSFVMEVSIPPAPQPPTATPTQPPVAPERINFAPGQSSAVRSDALPASQFKQYVFRALAGQEAIILLSSPGSQANFAVQGVTDGVTYKPFSNPAREFNFLLPRTQDYLISLNGPALLNYMLELTVPPPGPAPSPTATPTPPPVAPERINFAPGATSAVRSGALPASQIKQYVFRAAAGQPAHLLLASPGGQVNFALQGVGDGVTYKALADPAREFSLILPRDQDYLITLNGPAFLNYTLELTVLPVAPTATPTAAPLVPERINFSPEATSAARSGSLWANTPRAYVFGASMGQTARIIFSSPSPAAAFSVRGVSDGVSYKSMADPARDWSFTLPLSQDYLITLQAPVNTSFTLQLIIPPGELPTVAPSTPTATATFLPTATSTPTDMPSPTATATLEPTATATETPTLAPTPTTTETPTLEPTPTATETPTLEPTPTATETPTP